MLTQTQVAAFARDGFVKVAGAVPRDVADACAARLWDRIGLDPDDPATWTEPVVWVRDIDGGPFAEAASAQRLEDAYDQLVGPGRWVRRMNVGVLPLRFPHADEPDDAGWHIESSFAVPGSPKWHTNVHSRGRLLLMLFLFSDVGDADAPTRVRVGSHLDVPPVLEPFGAEGTDLRTYSPLVDAASAHRPVVHATGGPGDVYLCHPFLVHAAQPHHGTRPRFMSQPELYPREQITLDRPDGGYSVVEETIRAALA